MELSKEIQLLNTNENNALGALEVLHRDVIEIKAVLRELTMAITKLAVVEERQTQTTASLERAFSVLESLERRVTALELENPLNKRMTKAIDLLMVGAVVVVVGYILKHVGL